MKPARGREPLHGAWSLCEARAGSSVADVGVDEHAWMPIDYPLPVAASLRDAGRWSVDAPAPAFDAGDWWYRLRFDAAPAQAGERLVLGLDGLATLATVWLNGQELLASTNMFVAHACDVTALLRPSGNELLIRFASLDAQLAQRRKRPRWRVPMLLQQQLRWFRTTLLGRTPGWSPPAAAVGPWRGIWLQRCSDPLDAARVQLDASLEAGDGVVHCRVELPPDAPLRGTLALRLEREGRVHTQALEAAQGGAAWTGVLRVPQAALWWPHTHGEPALYDASLTLETASGAQAALGLDPVGFRRIEVDTSDGFRIHVNGTPVFCRGACWTPLDVVSLRSSDAQCRDALQQARDAGMNMLRLPGTGVYEEDHFYRACDALGILLWQDFMFASMDYPAEDAQFVASVTTEATQQLQRLRAHPSLCVLCGNSEAEQQAAMWGAPREQWNSPLFEEVLRTLCATHAPHIFYWPSSAHGGAIPHQADVGTTSYYGVGAYQRPLEDARRSGLRFATECLAFANVPPDSTIARMPGGLATRVHHPQWKARVPRDLGAGWDFEDVRDHYLQALYGVEPARLRYSDHERYLTLSRAVSGEVMAAAFSEWRRPASPCAGALILFLRDLWAGAGWGIVDDAGRPKACWHALRRVLQPVHLGISDEGGNGLYLHLVNEGASPLEGTLELAAWQYGETEVVNACMPVTLPARGARSVPALEMLDHFVDLGHAWRFGPPVCDVVAATLRDARGHVCGQAFHFPLGLPAAAQPDLDLAAECHAHADGAEGWQLVVTTRKLALSVHFDIPGFVAQDEHFHLAPGGQVRVDLRREGGAHGEPPYGSVLAINSARPVQITLAPPQKS